MSSSNNAIGGYFELELQPASAPLYPQALKHQSARAAFLALLRHAPNVKRVWMPHYICESMLAPVRASGKEICFYALNHLLAVSDQVKLATDDLLLYVNYFGVCSVQADALLQRFDPAQVVMDFSQAFYAAPRNCLATIYSPRKFFGLPDGGLMVTALPIAPPKVQDSGSDDRMCHLIKRLGDTPEAGYADFQHAEESLNDMEPLRMSMLTEKLLGSVDHETIRLKRNLNFQYIRRYLDSSNRMTLPDHVDGPLCYPFLPPQSISRNRFIQSRIYMATYWSEVINRVGDNTFEIEMVNQCLPIPCDQRYGESELGRVLDLL